MPIVGARIGGIAELIDDGRTGLLYDAASPAALEAALRRLIADRSLVTALGQPPAQVKSIAQDAREWTAVYGEVLNRRAGDGRVA